MAKRIVGSLHQYVLSIIVVLTTTNLCAQSTELSDLKPFFTSLIVEDIERSSNWYNDVLGFEEVSRTFMEERGIKLMNLTSRFAQLELLELKGAISANELLANHQSTRTLGIFKIGFTVESLDDWVNFLEGKDVTFHGNVVTDPVSGMRMLIVLDPDGNRIQIFER